MKKLSVLLFIPVQLLSQSAADIIKSGAEKIRSLKNISYSIYRDDHHEKISAEVTIERGHSFTLFDGCKYKASGIVLSEEDSKQISLGFNGTSYDFTDPLTKQLVKLDSPTYSKIGRTGMMIYDIKVIISVYWSKSPFEAILKGLKSAERLKDTIIYNRPAQVISITWEVKSEQLGTQSLSSIYYLDKENGLLCGQRSRFDSWFIKIRSYNDELPQNHFDLTSTHIKKISGLEPLSEGLLAIGTKAPAWKLSTTTKKTLSLDELKGKVVLLDFWGTWCVPCLKAMPDIQAIHEKFKDQPVEVIGVSVETESKADPGAYVKRKGYTYTIVLDGHKITKDYKVVQFPTIYIIDKKGDLIHAEHSGNRDGFKEDIIKKIQSVL